MGIVEEEADESNYWIELLIDSGIVKRERVVDLLQEGDEIVSIVVSSIKTARTGSTKPVSKSAFRIAQSEIV
jgi:four helix bundle protein